MKLLAVCAFLLLADQPAFEVASIKPSDSVTNGIGGYGITRDGSLSIRNVTLRYLIELAYSLESFRLSGGPAWLDTLRYYVDAKPAARVSRDQGQVMLQSLLAQRFQLQVHRENRTIDGYTKLLETARRRPHRIQSNGHRRHQRSRHHAYAVHHAESLPRWIGRPRTTWPKPGPPSSPPSRNRLASSSKKARSPSKS
jgi:uncharacterized protein (TIGR03435 family)